MNIGRQDLIDALESLSPGLAAKEVVEQSQSYLFKDDMIYTYNDEITIRVPFEIGFNGAVKAKALRDLLTKMPDEEIDISASGNEIRIKGKRRNAGIPLVENISLPIDDIPMPKKFVKVPAISKAVGLALFCASKDMTRPQLTCVHVNGSVAESCDNYRGCRVELESEFPEELLIPFKVANELRNFEIKKAGFTKSWVHFKSGDVVFSFRRVNESYPDVGPLFNKKGTKLDIPDGIADALGRAGIFSTAEFEQEQKVTVHLEGKKFTLKSRGEEGWFKETLTSKVEVKKPTEFDIHPKYLTEVKNKGKTKAMVSDNLIKLTTPDFTYVATLMMTDSED